MFKHWSKHVCLLAMAAAIVSAGLAGPARAQEERSYILATATTGGTYYPVGVALATLTKIKLQPKQKISISAISSAGSGENVKLLRENQAQFAILQGLYGAWARMGTGQVKAEGPQENLRSVTMLWQNVEHFIARSDFVESGDLSDINNLEGRKFSIGKRNSGTEGSGRTILTGNGIDPDTLLSIVYQGYGPSVDSMANGTIDGMNIPAGVPVSAVTRGASTLGDKMRVLNMTDEQMAAANEAAGIELWTRYVIEPNTYPGQAEEIRTMAQPNFLAVRDDVDEDAVYEITKTIYGNLDFLRAIHKATEAMSLEKAIAGLPMPLHPGAARFYREQGIEIPDHLIAP